MTIHTYFVVGLQIGASVAQTNVSIWCVDLKVSKLLQQYCARLEVNVRHG